MSQYIVQAQDPNDSVVINSKSKSGSATITAADSPSKGAVVTPSSHPPAPVVIKDEDQGKPVTFSGGRGPRGYKGDPGLDTPVFYGTGDPPDPTGLPDGAVFFKYKE